MAKHYTAVALTPTTDTWIPDYTAAVPALIEKQNTAAATSCEAPTTNASKAKRAIRTQP